MPTPFFVELPTPEPFADQILTPPIAKEKGEYTDKGKDPPEDWLCHFAYLIFRNIA